MKSIDELVSTWTREEREMLRDLIDECREREKTLIETSRVTQKNLMELTGSQIAFCTQSSELNKTIQSLGDNLFRIYLRLYNKKLPSS